MDDYEKKKLPFWDFVFGDYVDREIELRHEWIRAIWGRPIISEVPTILFKPDYQLDLRWVRPTDNRETAIRTVAKTVWTLWDYEVERVWALLRQWSIGRPVQKDACGEIIQIGFDNGHFYPEDAFRKLESWLTAGSEQQSTTATVADAEAAANLIEFVLPAMSKDSLSNLTSNWNTANLEKSLKGFCKAMQRIFERDPSWTLKMFSEWVRKNEKVYNDLVVGTLRGMPLKQEYDSTLEKQLMAVRTSCHDERVGKAIQSVVQKLRDRRSWQKNKTKRHLARKRSAIPQ